MLPVPASSRLSLSPHGTIPEHSTQEQGELAAIFQGPRLSSPLKIPQQMDGEAANHLSPTKIPVFLKICLFPKITINGPSSGAAAANLGSPGRDVGLTPPISALSHSHP